ncbi:trypsin-1-like [Bicyclus anynana]|uniref:Trypsin-1-like n=1 Tax=Bicyclus anynana TaxID=110368 RepID=A0ABM3M380_BICAN|nr:trypsin-1-like [Bicyclus anynana]
MNQLLKCTYCHVLLLEYDLIVIPIYNVKRSLLETEKWPKLTKYKRNDLSRLDIDHYEEATELIDIDNLDYNNDRNDVQLEINEVHKKIDGNLGRYGHMMTMDDGQDKIVGGTEVDINLYPYHAAYGTNCGGAILDKKWVITAGHCGKKPFIRVGSKYFNQGRKHNIKNYFVHPMWSASAKEHPFDFDFQLLELEEPLKFGDNVQPVKVAHIEDMVIGKVVSVTGWGNTQENGPYSSNLRAVRVPIIAKENCQRVPFPYFRGALTSRMFCAGFSEGKKDACQGDSGGPAVAYDRLLGMVSFGYGCATPGSYGVYSKVAKVRPWIQQVTGLTLD